MNTVKSERVRKDKFGLVGFQANWMSWFGLVTKENRNGFPSLFTVGVVGILRCPQ